MEEEMEELHIEGVTIHDDPESCVHDYEVGGEALTGACAGRANEARNQRIRGADVVYAGGRPHRKQCDRKLLAGPARSEIQGMHGTSMCENREIPSSPVWLMAGRAAQGRLRPYA
jgi:hypothetical protein